jgi:hypothetical protein
MIKLIALTAVTLALAGCSSMGMSTGNPAETKNSTDANKSGNKAAQSPGSGAAGSGAAK